ncbi:DUF421 domain-containing protein [Lysinibacillus sp. SGAir0095]|uniref:DUF421 domain-containing protein n=1 Tax=Lysinibacillus sp. SGAir0095 TaxID=2070463 RepID=UPI0010CCF2F5|nr:YetF domain-containing protein [Lysinibacillus sp. SGAir0095]QCR32451.1 hypothetical protein C1N55_09790 [Lysinibacillus sp. SGAir0095]
MEEMSQILVEFPLVLFLMFIVFRLMGSKELNQSTPIDFAFMVLLTSIGWDVTISQDFPLWFTFVLIILLVAMIYLFDLITSKSKRAEKIIIGEPLLLIEDGEIVEKALKKVRLSEDELLALLRLKGFFLLENIELCYLEFNGDISVKPKEG